MAQRPIITLTTDFGLNDHFVGTIKGAILSIAPEAEIVDICHSVQAFDILDGALALAQAYSYFLLGRSTLWWLTPVWVARDGPYWQALINTILLRLITVSSL